MDFDINSSLCNMKPIKLISETSFSYVYLVLNPRTKDHLVAKIYKVKLNTEIEKKYYMERIIAYSKIDEPTILPLVSFNLFSCDKNNLPTIIIDYMPKGSLDQYLCNEDSANFESKGLTITQRYVIAVGISYGMKYLHSQNIVHGNLRPSNILLDDQFHPHIINFFFSKNDYTKSEHFLYSAPENLLNFETTEKSDVYSFGILFYELLTNNKAYKETVDYEAMIYDNIQKVKRPNLNGISNPNVRNFLSQCWSEDPQERPSFPDIFEQIVNDSFYESFKVDSNEVNDYVCSFFAERIMDCSPKIKKRSQKTTRYRINVTLKNGKGIRIGEYEGPRYLKLAAEYGNAEAMYHYSLLLSKGGSGVKVNKREAARYMKMSADKGNSNAMFKYGIMLYTGDGIPLNKKEASTYFKKAADGGSVNAMFNIAYMYDNGEGIPVNKPLAVSYYKKAADGGNVEAMISYAVMIEKGEGVEANQGEAVKYYKKAADKGNLDAMLSYGYLCDKGEGTEVNKKEAVKYYKMGADKGSVRSMVSYAYKLNDGDGIEMNKKEAARFFKMAGDKGDTEGMLRYSLMAYQGHGVEMDKKEAAKYAKMSADNGNPYAMYFYGIFLLTGEGLDVNKKEAAVYLKKSADNGNIHAMCRYGVMLSKGDGIKMDKTEAAKYFQMANDRGYSLSDEFEEDEEDF